MASALAGTEVVLQDGQVIQATEVRRDGDMFLITLPAGGTASLPAGSVASVRLGDDPPPPAAADAKPDTTGGLTYSNKGTQISGAKLPENKNYPTVVCHLLRLLRAAAKMSYLYLAIAIVAEVIGTSALKAAEGFTRPLPSLVVVVGYAAAFYFLSLALKVIPVGIAYAIWSGVGWR